MSAGLVSIVIGLPFATWTWYQDAAVIFSVLGYIGGALGPVGGIVLAGFHLVRRRRYDLRSFYVRDGECEYTNGRNLRAVAATALGLIVSFVGSRRCLCRVLAADEEHGRGGRDSV